MLKLLIPLFLSLITFLHAEPKIIGYYPNWAIYRNPSLKPENIDGSLMTHINYAFIKVDEQGNLSLFDSWADVEYRSDWISQKPFWGNFEQLIQLKKKYPHLKTLFSVGGWTLSDPFSKMAANAQARQNFVQQCINFCEQYQFDGIDIDWEYPGFATHSGQPEDTKNFTLLLQELFIAAKTHSPSLLVTIAAPAGPAHMQNIEIEQIHPYLDWINLMTYDFSGAGWSDNANHHAPLYPSKHMDPLFCVDAAVKGYLSQGVPSEKIVLGIPFYGRSFKTINPTKDGLYSNYSGPGLGTTMEVGMRFYHDIKRNLLNSYIRYWDPIAKVPYLFNPNNHEFITYEDEKSLTLKCDYLKKEKLGGAMVWELGLDVYPTWEMMTTLKNHLK